MKITKSQLFTVEMSFEELVAIKKVIGSTSSKQRIEEMRLTKEQDAAAEKLFESLDAYLEKDVAG